MWCADGAMEDHRKAVDAVLQKLQACKADEKQAALLYKLAGADFTWCHIVSARLSVLQYRVC